jgi:hypothetical protein
MLICDGRSARNFVERADGICASVFGAAWSFDRALELVAVTVLDDCVALGFG